MAEATDSLHLAQLRTRLSIAARTRAPQVALNLTKARLRAQGLPRFAVLTRRTTRLR